jgi:hypothetical protein
MKTYRRKKPKHTFYFDYVIHDGKCYLLFETADNMVYKKFICDTDKLQCETLYDKNNFVYIKI